MKGVIKEMLYVRCKNRGFTLVELLTVLAIITMLLGLLVPSLNMVRRIAKETKQKAQLGTIGMGLQGFRNDFGDYPPSDSWSWLWNPFIDGLEVEAKDYAGAQKLAEALVGWDLTGFHPDSQWRADGRNAAPYLGRPRKAYFFYDQGSAIDIDKRKGAYIDLGVRSVVKLGAFPREIDGLFDPAQIGELHPERFVLCDVFGWKKVQVGENIIKAGAPVLYYRADTSSRTLDGASVDDRIYDARDNIDVIAAKNLAAGKPADVGLGDSTSVAFYNYITDGRVPRPWPYRPDSYLLITAGADGIYGTGDDICNFGN
ncbi:MAG: type II secretion system protein [Planctomycetota bacterium]